MSDAARRAFEAIDRGEFDSALQMAGAAASLNPRDDQALHAGGLAAHRLQRLDEAKDWMRRALELNASDAALLNNYAAVLRDLGDRQGALRALALALKLVPGHPIIHAFMGELHLSGGAPDQALRHLDAALAVHPEFAAAVFQRGNALSALGRSAEAVRDYSRASELAPEFSGAHFNLANELCRMGHVAESLPRYRRAIALDPASAALRCNLITALQYVADETEIAAACREFSEAIERPVAPAFPVKYRSGEPRRKWKVGYVSADLRRHSVGYFMLPLIEGHRRDRFEVHCYYNHVIRDDMQQRFEAAADHWIPCHSMDDEQLSARVRADGIDILVDLSGHTAGNRLGVFARKPAPLQVSYLGYPGSTGLKAIDGRITDPIADPLEGHPDPETGGLFRLRDGFLCYRPALEAGPVHPLPALKNGFLTFCSFNILQKISPEVVELWSRILQASPGSRLLLKSQGLEHPSIRDVMAQRFGTRGIDPQRISIVGFDADPASHFARYGQADIALDPFPYNGTTTSCEALWMGVPVLSLRGTRHASRVGASLLTLLGMQDWIAEDKDSYVAQATKWSAMIPELARLRAELRVRFEQSPLRDETAFVDKFEHALMSLWADADAGAR